MSKDYAKICQELREKYDYTAQCMSKLYGFGVNQWRLYEKGKPPSASNAKLIDLSCHPMVFRMLQLNSPRLMQINQTVRWPKRGFANTFHIGKIIAIVPAGILPTVEWLSQSIQLSALRNWYLETTIPRDHESYMVINRAGKTSNSMCRLLWPVVKQLEPVIDPSDLGLDSEDYLIKSSQVK